MFVTGDTAGLGAGLLPGLTVTVTMTSSVTTTLFVTTSRLRRGELRAVAANRAQPRIAKRIFVVDVLDLPVFLEFALVVEDLTGSQHRQVFVL